MSVNPLVAAPAPGEPSAWAGVWIAEDIELIASGIRSDSWVDTSLGVVSAGLDGLALVSDPVGALLQYGIAWLIEHVEPLSEALDWLAGDPAQIAAHAQTWRNVAGALRTESENLTGAIRSGVREWTGSAADAYRRWASRRAQSLTAPASGADTMALITEGAGALIGTVRLMVRDAVATVVSRLIVYAGELVATAGLAAPLVAEQVGTLCAAWAARIARWLRALLASLRNLLRECGRLGDLINRRGIRPSSTDGRMRRGRSSAGGGTSTSICWTNDRHAVAELTESQRRWEGWYAAYAQVTDAWPDRPRVPCPDGDGGHVLVAYMGRPLDGIGTAVVWCDRDLTGIYLHRVDIPDGAPVVPFGADRAERDRVIPPGIRFLQPDPEVEELPDR